MPFLLVAILALFLKSSPTQASEACLPFGGEVGLGYDYFRSIPDGDWEGNTGALVSANLAAPFLCLDKSDVGIQVGGSYGIYDWSGRGSSPSDLQLQSQQQSFLTIALYNKTFSNHGVNAGIGFDWMWNKNFGVFALQNNMAQFRYQIGYLLCTGDEWGIWGASDLYTSTRISEGIPVEARAISQVNLYWEHTFVNCARTKLWGGAPTKKSLSYPSGRAGQFILGGSFHAPLASRLSIDGHASYMKGHSAVGAFKQRNYAANICIELKWAFGNGSSATTPYMPIGNNSNFIADTNLTF